MKQHEVTLLITECWSQRQNWFTYSDSPNRKSCVWDAPVCLRQRWRGAGHDSQAIMPRSAWWDEMPPRTSADHFLYRPQPDYTPSFAQGDCRGSRVDLSFHDDGNRSLKKNPTLNQWHYLCNQPNPLPQVLHWETGTGIFLNEETIIWYLHFPSSGYTFHPSLKTWSLTLVDRDRYIGW